MTIKSLPLTVGTALLLCACTAPLSAQLASASTPALGMGENYTALARGYNAVAWNPAGLALSGGPGWSFTLFNLRGIAGLDPITLSDLAEFEDQLIPESVKRDWLAQIRQEESQSGSGGFDATWLALQIGRFGIQVSSSARTILDLSPGIAELILFGNADENWNPVTVDLAGSAIDMAAYSTAGLSWGQPFTMAGGMSKLSVGVTAKYTVGHVFARSLESSGTASTEPLQLTMRFPIVHTPFPSDSSEAGTVGEDEEFSANNGSGIGLDVGIGFETGIWTFSAVVQNVVNTFKWDDEMLRFRPGEITANQDTTVTNFDAQPIATAPAGFAEQIADLKFKPSFAVGALARVSHKLNVTADLRIGSEEGIISQATQHIGVGIEFRPLSFLPLRAGAALVKLGEHDSGAQFGAGIGLNILGANLAASALLRDTGLGRDNLVQVTFLGRGGN